MATELKTSWWANVLLYGLSLGILLAALEFSRFRLLRMNHSEELYVGLTGLVFVVLGIWAGRKLANQPTIPLAPPAPFQPKEGVLEKLGITPRELEVLEQMALGLSNQEIAEKLFVSLNTVKTHGSNVFSKLGVQRRTQAIQRAKELGLLA